MNPFDLTGRRYLVTGASSGIGRAICEFLCQCGGSLVLIGRRQEILQKLSADLPGGKHAWEKVDLESDGDLSKRLKQWAERHGKFNGLVYAAGIQATEPLRLLDTEIADRMWRVNVRAALSLAKGFASRSVRESPASMVFISSITALIGLAAVAGYSSSKGAIVSAVRSIAVELAKDGIRANCIAPGYVHTPMLDAVGRVLDETRMAALEASHPLGFGQPSDVAHAVAFLLSDGARWITGTTLVVDGGYTAQ